MGRIRGICLGLLLAASSASAQLIGDADCDGVLTPNDVSALAARIFRPEECGQADPNLDGATTAADLPAQYRLVHEALQPTPTPTPEVGPAITYFGLAAASGSLLSESERTDTDIPIFSRNAGLGFSIVVEAAAGLSGSPVGQTLLNSQPGDPFALPDLQILPSRNVGQGSTAVCDTGGGVPGIDPPRFEPDMAITNAINDFACRFRAATTRSAVCTLDDFETANFARMESQIQFCLQITGALAFPPGDTLVVVRARDRLGNPGAPKHLIVRVPGGVPTATPTATPQAPSRTPTRTWTPTREPSHTPTLTPSPAPSSPTPSITPITPQPSRTPTATLPGPSRTPTPTQPGPSPTRTPTRTPSLTPPITPTRTPTSLSVTATPTRTASRTPTPSPTRTPTTGGEIGPRVSFIGLTRGDDCLVPVAGTMGEIPIYERPIGSGFHIVVEASRGSANRPIGLQTFVSDPFDPTVLPDLQIQVNRGLGDEPTLDVCDDTPPIGGVPGIDPPDFSPAQLISNAINDLACRFTNGTGDKLGRARVDAGVLFESGDRDFVLSETDIQFYSGPIPPPVAFPSGDTLVSARVRNVDGLVSPVKQMIVRVGIPQNIEPCPPRP